MAKYDVFVIQVRSRAKGQKKLHPIGVLATVSHRQDARSIVPVKKVFILKGGTIDTRGARTISVDKVSTLSHEPTNYTVEDRIQVPLPRPWLLKEVNEILHGFWNTVVVQYEFQASEWLVTSLNIHKGAFHHSTVVDILRVSKAQTTTIIYKK
mmetsp:Transcript_23450/g.41596  ORF Transcript_23450/g.41596 Transcript_23450/m.41596 type:complete len:153 (-) Transcript_23450:18-476(-)